MTLEIVDAKSSNNNSISANTDIKDNKTANGKTDSLETTILQDPNAEKLHLY